MGMSLLLALVGAGCFPLLSCGQGGVCLSIEGHPFQDRAEWAGFDRSVHVLDCVHVVAERGIPDAQLLHVAAVVAELLDQDEDGVVDHLPLQVALAAGEAVMPVLQRERSKGEKALMRGYDGEGIAAVLYADEVDPSAPGFWGSDATVEEVLHTIHSVGHVSLYPEALALIPHSSRLTEALDVARGGHFLTVPRTHPEDAWFHYDDRTCAYDCMAIEYLYWATVTYMGLLDDPWIAASIADEWTLTTPEMLEQTDGRIHALLTDVRFGLPVKAPDGQYCPSGK